MKAAEKKSMYSLNNISGLNGSSRNSSTIHMNSMGSNQSVQTNPDPVIFSKGVKVDQELNMSAAHSNIARLVTINERGATGIVKTFNKDIILGALGKLRKENDYNDAMKSIVLESVNSASTDKDKIAVLEKGLAFLETEKQLSKCVHSGKMELDEAKELLSRILDFGCSKDFSLEQLNQINERLAKLSKNESSNDNASTILASIPKNDSATPITLETQLDEDGENPMQAEQVKSHQKDAILKGVSQDLGVCHIEPATNNEGAISEGTVQPNSGTTKIFEPNGKDGALLKKSLETSLEDESAAPVSDSNVNNEAISEGTNQKTPEQELSELINFFTNNRENQNSVNDAGEKFKQLNELLNADPLLQNNPVYTNAVKELENQIQEYVNDIFSKNENDRKDAFKKLETLANKNPLVQHTPMYGLAMLRHGQKKYNEWKTDYSWANAQLLDRVCLEGTEVQGGKGIPLTLNKMQLLKDANKGGTDDQNFKTRPMYGLYLFKKGETEKFQTWATTQKEDGSLVDSAPFKALQKRMYLVGTTPPQSDGICLSAEDIVKLSTFDCNIQKTPAYGLALFFSLKTQTEFEEWARKEDNNGKLVASDPFKALQKRMYLVGTTPPQSDGICLSADDIVFLSMYDAGIQGTPVHLLALFKANKKEEYNKWAICKDEQTGQESESASFKGLIDKIYLEGTSHYTGKGIGLSVADFVALGDFDPRIQKTPAYKLAKIIKDNNLVLHQGQELQTLRTRVYRDGTTPSGEQTILVPADVYNLIHRFTYDEAQNLVEEKGQSLCSGSLGEVYKVKGKDGKWYAVKILKNPDNDTIYAFSQEKKANEYAQNSEAHGIFADYRGSFIINGNYVMITEWIDNHADEKPADGSKYNKAVRTASDFNLTNHINNLLLPGFNGVAQMHKTGLFHRDLKLENMMIQENEGKLQLKFIDLGTVCTYTGLDDPEKKGVGTPTYMAPEILNNEPYSFPADVYSMGIVLLEGLFGEVFPKENFKFPWHISNYVQEGNLSEALADGNFDGLVSEGVITKESLNFLKGKLGNDADKKIGFLAKLVADCTAFNPQERITAEQAAYLLTKFNDDKNNDYNYENAKSEAIQNHPKAIPSPILNKLTSEDSKTQTEGMNALKLLIKGDPSYIKTDSFINLLNNNSTVKKAIENSEEYGLALLRMSGISKNEDLFKTWANKHEKITNNLANNLKINQFKTKSNSNEKDSRIPLSAEELLIFGNSYEDFKDNVNYGLALCLQENEEAFSQWINDQKNGPQKEEIKGLIENDVLNDTLCLALGSKVDDFKRGKAYCHAALKNGKIDDFLTGYNNNTNDKTSIITNIHLQGIHNVSESEETILLSKEHFLEIASKVPELKNKTDYGLALLLTGNLDDLKTWANENLDIFDKFSNLVQNNKLNIPENFQSTYNDFVEKGKILKDGLGRLNKKPRENYVTWEGENGTLAQKLFAKLSPFTTNLNFKVNSWTELANEKNDAFKKTRFYGLALASEVFYSDTSNLDGRQESLKKWINQNPDAAKAVQEKIKSTNVDEGKKQKVLDCFDETNAENDSKQPSKVENNEQDLETTKPIDAQALDQDGESVQTPEDHKENDQGTVAETSSQSTGFGIDLDNEFAGATILQELEALLSNNVDALNKARDFALNPNYDVRKLNEFLIFVQENTHTPEEINAKADELFKA